jgi:RNA ligase (TIGR02306 family)
MKLVTFEYITELLPIEGADKIELARIQGWQSVIKKGEYKVGDRVIFIPIDTVIEPADWNQFLWDKKDPTKPIRIKTAKLRGAISQGVIFPMTIINRTASIWNKLFVENPPKDAATYEDLAQALGISKYEKPVPVHLAGQVAGDFPTHLVSKTDEDNLKSNIEALDELKQADFVEATLKIDGTSATYIKEFDGTFRVCSRNLELKDTEGNVHWQMARKYRIEESLVPGNCIQGEIAGPGIQGNPAGYSEVSLFVFNTFNLGDRKPLSRNSWFNALTVINDQTNKVPIVRLFDASEFATMDIDSLQEWVNKITYDNNKPAEGIVFRGIKDGKIMYSKKLQKMLSVKIINQNYKD